MPDSHRFQSISVRVDRLTLCAVLSCAALTSQVYARPLASPNPAVQTTTARAAPPVVSLEGLDGSIFAEDVPRKASFERFSVRDGLDLDGLVSTVSLTPIDLDRVRAEDEASAKANDKRLRYGIGRDIDVSFADGVVLQLSDGSVLWTVDVLLQGAIGVRLHLTDLELPAGAQLIVYGTDAPHEILGPFEGLGLLGDGQFWTSTRSGERVRLECRIPNVKRHDDLRDLGFRIDRVIHVYRNPAGGGSGGEAGSDPGAGACHNDVTCYSSAENTKRMVAGVGFISGDALFCSGAMLNNFSGDFAPFLMTANHCLNSIAMALSAEIYWRYETSSCNASPPVLSSVPQSAVCTLLSTGTASDYTLLRVEGAIPTAQLYWSGWSTATPPNGNTGNCIHHPSGDYKRISFGTYSSSTSCGGSSHFRVNWTNGPTEQGSSGSPYLADGYGFVGQLHCGPSACGNETSDQYGSWSATYPNVSDVFNSGAGDDLLEDNDSCAAALPLSPGQYNGLIVKLVDEDWYRITIQANKALEVNATFTDAFGDIDLQLYSSCGGSTVATANSGTNNETLTYVNTGSTAFFYLRVYLWDQDVLNDYDMDLSITPVNDDCINATAIGDGVYSGTLSGATNDGTASCGFTSSSPDVWYSYTATCDGTLTVSTCGTHDGPGQDQGIDTVVSLHSGCGGAELACDDDDESPQIACAGLDQGFLRDSAVQIPVTIGMSLRIRVANFNNGGTGPFTLRVSCQPDPPPNDNCASAITVTDGSHVGTLIGATNDGTASCGFSSSSPDVWYFYRAICDGTLTVSTCGTNDGPGLDMGIDTVISLYSGCAGAELACNDDDIPQIACTGLDVGIFRDSAVQIPVTVGMSLWIRVANFNNGAAGPFTLGITCTSVGANIGTPFCDGSGGNCPCGAAGLSDHGCPNTNTNGNGAKLVGNGNAQFTSDSFGLKISNAAPMKPGIIIQGATALNYPNGNANVPNASGIFCVNPQLRGNVFFTNGGGAATVTSFQGNPFGSTAQPFGGTTYYQYWFRDPGNPCQNAPANAAAFNFSNGVEVDWLN